MINKCALYLFLLIPGLSLAQGDWYWNSNAQLLLKKFSGSEMQDRLTGLGFQVKADYLERSELAFAYNYNNIGYKAIDNSVPDRIDEHVFFISGKYNSYPNSLPGIIGWRVDVYSGHDDLIFNSKSVTSAMGSGMGRKSLTEIRYSVNNNFKILNPIISYKNFSKTLYLDLGFARSQYQFSGAFDDFYVSQITPTLGVGFNRSYDWLQFRPYFIKGSDDLVGYKNATRAVELKWTHWSSSEAGLGAEYYQLSLLGGELAYGVDSDTCSVCNMPDLVTGSITGLVSWKIGDDKTLLIKGGYQTFNNLSIDNKYSSVFVYGHISRKW